MRPFFVLGGGSNVIAKDAGFDGVILLNRIPGFEVLTEDSDGVTLRIGAGEVWDDVVARTVEMNLSGIEALSAIPGTAGATPVQNVGAYGQEIADTLIELDAIDTATAAAGDAASDAPAGVAFATGAGRCVRLSKRACGFAYRSSIFKDPATRHHIITSMTLRLKKESMKPPFYASLQQHLDQVGERDRSPRTIRQAVIAIRESKLPDPKRVANSGSFFKNPIVPGELAGRLAARYPAIPIYPAGEGHVKLAAGWLIEQAGLKGYASHGFMTSPDNALVIINRSAQSFVELERFAGEIIAEVHRCFGVLLSQEPETL